MSASLTSSGRSKNYKSGFMLLLGAVLTILGTFQDRRRRGCHRLGCRCQAHRRRGRHRLVYCHGIRCPCCLAASRAAVPAATSYASTCSRTQRPASIRQAPMLPLRTSGMMTTMVLIERGGLTLTVPVVPGVGGAAAQRIEVAQPGGLGAGLSPRRPLVAAQGGGAAGHEEAVAVVQGAAAAGDLNQAVAVDHGPKAAGATDVDAVVGTAASLVTGRHEERSGSSRNSHGCSSRCRCRSSHNCSLSSRTRRCRITTCSHRCPCNRCPIGPPWGQCCRMGQCRLVTGGEAHDRAPRWAGQGPRALADSGGQAKQEG